MGAKRRNALDPALRTIQSEALPNPAKCVITSTAY